MKLRSGGVTTFGFETRATKVKVNSRDLIVDLADGRKIQVPLAWFPRLIHATSAQRKRFQMIGPGIGIHWPEIDEDISVASLLNPSAYPLIFKTVSKPVIRAAEPRAKYGRKK